MSLQHMKTLRIFNDQRWTAEGNIAAWKLLLVLIVFIGNDAHQSGVPIYSGATLMLWWCISNQRWIRDCQWVHQQTNDNHRRGRADMGLLWLLSFVLMVILWWCGEQINELDGNGPANVYFVWQNLVHRCIKDRFGGRKYMRWCTLYQLHVNECVHSCIFMYSLDIYM